MASHVLNQLIVRLLCSLARASGVLVSALVLTIGVIVAEWQLLPELDEALARKEEAVVKAERILRRQTIANPDREVTPDVARAKVLDQFRGEPERTITLRRLQEIARDHGLQLPVGEYRLVAAKGGPLERYVLTMPVRGSYLTVRRYVAAVRDEFGDLAIEEISLRRESIAAADIEAILRLVIFARNGQSS